MNINDKESNKFSTMYRYSIINKANGEEIESFDTDKLYHFPINHTYNYENESYYVVNVHDNYTSVKRGKNFLRVVSIYVISTKAEIYNRISN